MTRVVAAARTPEELESLLTEVWTPGELRDAAQRVEVAAQLLEGNTYEVIAQQTGASTATISRVRRSLERGAGMLEHSLQRVGRAGVHYARRHWASGGIID
ncbi:MAG: YerC/YecD family TrpR-related protein [Thermaerobacter sp.]|nr:YerC/YecD family TrpR-related protein [Thermaerobacter sp.]